MKQKKKNWSQSRLKKKFRLICLKVTIVEVVKKNIGSIYRCQKISRLQCVHVAKKFSGSRKYLAPSAYLMVAP